MSTDRLFDSKKPTDEKKPIQKPFNLGNEIYFRAGPVPLSNRLIGLIGTRNVNTFQVYIIDTLNPDKPLILEHPNAYDITSLNDKQFATIGDTSLHIWNIKDFSYQSIDAPLGTTYEYHNAISIAGRYIIFIYQNWQIRESKLLFCIDTVTLETQTFHYETPAATWNTPWKLNLSMLPHNQLAICGGGQYGIMLFDFTPQAKTWLTFNSTILYEREVVYFLPWNDNAFWAIYEVNNAPLANGLTQWFPKLSVWHVQQHTLVTELMTKEAFLDHAQPKLSAVIVDGVLVHNSGRVGEQKIAAYNPCYDLHVELEGCNGRHHMVAMPNDHLFLEKSLSCYELYPLAIPHKEKTKLQKAIAAEMQDVPEKISALITSYALECRFFKEKNEDDKPEDNSYRVMKWVRYFL